MVDFKRNFSLEGWNLIEFLKGRKKLCVAALGMLLTYLVSNSESAAFISGIIIEMLFAGLEYWWKAKN